MKRKEEGDPLRGGMTSGFRRGWFKVRQRGLSLKRRVPPWWECAGNGKGKAGEVGFIV